MKIRYGFVTNSSSSSFVIAFKSKADIESDVRKIFDDVPFCEDVRGMTREDATETAMQWVLNAVKRDKISRTELKKILKEEFSSRARWIYYYNTNNFPRLGREYLNSAEYKKLEKEYVAKRMEEVLNLLDGKSYIVYTSFSDNDGCIGSYLEHDAIPLANNTICSFNHH